MGKFSFSKKQDDVPRRRRGVADDARRETQEQRQTEASTFQRNRTLTGSLSSRISSASELSGNLQSSRTHAHHLARQRRKLSSVLVGVLAVCALIAGLIFELTARPVVSSVDGGIALQHERYQKAIDDYLSRHPVERLRFVLNTDRLGDDLRKTLPEVATVKSEGFAGFGASHFSLGLRKPIAGWMLGATQYYVDASGVPFQLNYYETPGVRIVDQSGVAQAAGTAIASGRFLNFVGRTVAIASQYQLNVEQAIIPANTTRQIELKVVGHSYPVKLSLDRPVGEQVEDMQRALAYLDSKGAKPQYVDVRVSGKAYYK